MKNISQIKDCYGCGVCATICPKSIISISLNDEGFYQPCIADVNRCINCGLCLNVCSFSNDGLSLKAEQIRGYAGWSNNQAVRRKCSSGGVAFEVGCALLNQGYEVCAVRYNPLNQIAEHYIAKSAAELIPSIGSKYIQSYTLNGFKAIDRKKKYLVVGTPCQIDSFRRLIRKWKVEDNFVLMDFYCHGVPSMLLWNKYIKEAEKITGPISYSSWRNKRLGWNEKSAFSINEEEWGEKVDWHDSYNILIKGDKQNFNSRCSQGDLFYKFFLKDVCLGKACYSSCKFKALNSSADIRIGDFWGSEYSSNEEGVNALVVFTEKGNSILKGTNSSLVEHPVDIVMQAQMKHNPNKPKIRGLFIRKLQDGSFSIKDIDKFYNRYHLPQRVINLLKRRVIGSLRFFNKK